MIIFQPLYHQIGKFLQQIFKLTHVVEAYIFRTFMVFWHPIFKLEKTTEQTTHTTMVITNFSKDVYVQEYIDNEKE